MDTIAFRQMYIDNLNWGGHIHAEIIINGTPFAEIAEKYERIAAEKGTGDYKKFDYVYDLADSLYRQLAENEMRDEKRNQKSLMICAGCYEAGCWGLHTTVEDNGIEVIWSNINNYHMAEASDRLGWNWWDYSVFPSFRFAKDDYLAALKDLKVISDVAKDFHMLSYSERENRDADFAST